MNEPKSIVSYQTAEYGHVIVTLSKVMDARKSPATVCEL